MKNNTYSNKYKKYLIYYNHVKMNEICNSSLGKDFDSNFTKSYNNEGYYNNNQNFNNLNSFGSTMMYNQVLTMTIIPLITTLFTTFSTLIINNINKLIKLILDYYNQKISNKKYIEFDLYFNNNPNEYNMDAIHLIWYINKTNSVKGGKLISFIKLKNNENGENVDILLCPAHAQDDKTSNNINNINNNRSMQYANMQLDNNNNIKENDNNNQDFRYIKINDERGIFYYGINNNKISIMSYEASINNIGEYIFDIMTKYEEHKSIIIGNIITEKQIFIELYVDIKINGFSSNLPTELNVKAIPIIWYLNKKKIITKGLLAKKDSINNNNSRLDYYMPPQQQMPDKFNSKKEDNQEIIIIPIIEKNNINNNTSNDKNKDQTNDKKSQNNNDNNNNKQEKFEIDKDIFCQLVLLSKKGQYGETNKEHIIISSEKYSINELSDYLEGIEKQYNEYMSERVKNKYLYSYISTKSINKFSKINLDKTQTFEHLFFDKKKEILNDIKNFTNIDYYNKFSFKRKLGYLFCGPPGSGKTALVTAITNELKRSLKSIPISLIDTNSEFEEAYNNTTFDGVTIQSDEIVITFDEIDSALESQNLTKNLSNNNDKTDSNNDKKEQNSNQTIIINNKGENNEESCLKLNKRDDMLNIGIILSKIDGNESQDGTVIIATCNDKSKLDPALYRNGRLKLIELNYAGSNEIKEMIEKYCEKTLSQNQIEKIRNDKIIQTLNIKHVIAKYLLEKNFDIDDDDVNEITDNINKL